MEVEVEEDTAVEEGAVEEEVEGIGATEAEEAEDRVVDREEAGAHTTTFHRPAANSSAEAVGRVTGPPSTPANPPGTSTTGKPTDCAIVSLTSCPQIYGEIPTMFNAAKTGLL